MRCRPGCAQRLVLVVFRDETEFDNRAHRETTRADSGIAKAELQDMVARELIEQTGSRRWAGYKVRGAVNDYCSETLQPVLRWDLWDLASGQRIDGGTRDLGSGCASSVSYEVWNGIDIPPTEAEGAIDQEAVRSVLDSALADHL